MGRPPLHPTDAFIDAAVTLFAAGGTRAVTMAAVAREVGAPSGSIYHRFPDRSALLAAVWLRTTRRFEDAYQRAAGDEPDPTAALRAATSVVDWCREHLAEAVVLHAGKAAFAPDQWSDDDARRCAAAERERDARINRLARTVADQTGRRRDEVAFALFDLPLAAVRRHLQAGEPPPKRTRDLVRRVAGLVLGVGP